MSCMKPFLFTTTRNQRANINLERNSEQLRSHQPLLEVGDRVVVEIVHRDSHCGHFVSSIAPSSGSPVLTCFTCERATRRLVPTRSPVLLLTRITTIPGGLALRANLEFL